MVHLRFSVHALAYGLYGLHGPLNSILEEFRSILVAVRAAVNVSDGSGTTATMMSAEVCRDQFATSSAGINLNCY